MLRSDNGLALILHDQGSTQALAGFIQRGIHSGIDLFSSPDITVYDSLLTLQLQEYGIRLPHHLEYFRTHTTPDSSQVFVDTLGRVQSAGYLPSKKAVRYDYTLNMSLSETYRLTMEPVDGLILKQMGGILATSLVILLILGFTFGYLVRTILRAKDAGGDEKRLYQQHHPRTEDAHRRSVCRQRRIAPLRACGGQAAGGRNTWASARNSCNGWAGWSSRSSP